MTLSLESRQAQLDKESAVQHRERLVFLRLCNEAQQRAHMVHEQHQFVAEEDAQIHVVRHQYGFGQRASLRILASVSQECDVTR